MATTALNIEDNLEAGVMIELAKRDYFKTGGAGAGTVIRHYMDASARPLKYVVVHASAEKIDPNFNKWKAALVIAAVVHIPDDVSGAIVKAFYAECLDFLHRLDKSALGTSSGLTIDGIVMKSRSESTDEQFRLLSANADIFITKS